MNRYAFEHAAGKPAPRKQDEGRLGHPGKQTLVERLVAEAGALGAAPAGQDLDQGKQDEDPRPGPAVAGERRTEPKMPPPPDGATDQKSGGERGELRGERGDLSGGQADAASPGGGATPDAAGGQGDGRAPIKITHATAKAAADGSDESRTTVGVGETVTFRASLGGTWSASDGSLPVTTGTTATWTAPDGGRDVSIIFNDPTGRGVTVAMKVVAPSTVTMKLASSQNDVYGAKDAGSGMFCEVSFGPTNVSFGNVQMREVPGPATNITGYFLEHYMPHFHTAGGDANWHKINDNNVLSVTDDVSSAGYPSPWSDGTFDWVIPNKYFVGGAGAEYDLATTKQSFVIKGDGTVTVSKQGAVSKRTPPTQVGAKASGSAKAGSSGWPF